MRIELFMAVSTYILLLILESVFLFSFHYEEERTGALLLSLSSTYTHGLNLESEVIEKFSNVDTKWSLKTAIISISYLWSCCKAGMILFPPAPILLAMKGFYEHHDWPLDRNDRKKHTQKWRTTKRLTWQLTFNPAGFQFYYTNFMAGAGFFTPSRYHYKKPLKSHWCFNWQVMK